MDATYSITLSARASSVGGISRPSNLLPTGAGWGTAVNEAVIRALGQDVMVIGRPPKR
jgi:hypothetical protein